MQSSLKNLLRDLVGSSTFVCVDGKRYKVTVDDITDIFILPYKGSLPVVTMIRKGLNNDNIKNHV